MWTRSGRAAAQGTAADTSANGGSERHRAETTLAGSWLVLGKDGRLTAYARARAGLLRWTQTRPGGAEWTGPDLFPVAGLTDLHVVQGADTYVHFLGRREVTKGDGPPAVDVVHAIQYQTGRPVTEWRSLGNPHKDAAKAARFGTPTGAVSAGGNVHVFARNAGGGVMLRRELAGGKWSAWTDLKGRLVQDPVAVVAFASGHVEALAGGQDLVMRWTQEKPDGAFAQTPTMALSVARGSVVGLETAPDRATYYWTDPESGGVVAHRPDGPVIPLGGTPAEGPMAVLRVPLDGYDCTVLAHRDVGGRVVLAACGTENEQAGVWWSPTRERGVGAPALARDAYGRVVLGVIDAGGALRIARQNDEAGLALAPSVAV
ncbi:hypothetical protein [Streptomyces caniscabiei]|uniref:hypothetical protein n=1 Tax=Streptomyces caniscabiei TaxID=2746961 RepID=UPI0007660CF5|nr:hypothetical protein [Streptomyces caniscabiei]